MPVTGFTAFGEQTTNPQFTNPTLANPKVNYTFLKGSHSFKIGYEYGWLAQAISDFHPKFGADTYAGQFSALTSTQFAAACPTGPSGQPISSAGSFQRIERAMCSS